MERAWRHAHASVMGSSHHRSGAPCQDASTCEIRRRADASFLLAAVASKFHLLNYGLAIILVFIGVKMCLVDVFKIPVLVSLGVIVGVLAATMLLSLRTATASTHPSPVRPATDRRGQ